MENDEKKPDRMEIEAVFDPDDYLYFYGNALKPERTKAEVEFIIRELYLNKNMRILDLACGHGRHANLLASKGFDITGLDIMSGFLDIARKNANQMQVSVDYKIGDMRKLDFNQEFDCVLLLFTAFGYFDDATNEGVIHSIQKALKPNGYFCFDTINRDYLLKHHLPYIVTSIGNDHMIDRNSIDIITGRQINRRLMIKNGVQREMYISVRLYTPPEVVSLLERAGMQLVKFCGDLDGKPLTVESRRMYVIATKSTE